MSARFEESDAHVRPLLLFAAGLAILIVASFFAMRLLERSYEEADPALTTTHPMQAFRPGPEGPLLQAVPSEELHAQRALEERLLDTYGWVDRENGLARIPIERAMELVSRRGLPARAQSGAENGG